MAQDLHRLVYRSRSLLEGSPEECQAEVARILATARANNAAAGLTGALLFDGATFLQVVEGPMAEIERAYETIACDSRHELIELIELAGIDARQYDAWTMAFLDGGGADPALRRALSQVADLDTPRLGKTLADAMRTLLHPA